MVAAGLQPGKEGERSVTRSISYHQKMGNFVDEDQGGFHLVDSIITELKSHMTC